MVLVVTWISATFTAFVLISSRWSSIPFSKLSVWTSWQQSVSCPHFILMFITTSWYNLYLLTWSTNLTFCSPAEWSLHPNATLTIFSLGKTSKTELFSQTFSKYSALNHFVPLFPSPPFMLIIPAISFFLLDIALTPSAHDGWQPWSWLSSSYYP